MECRVVNRGTFRFADHSYRLTTDSAWIDSTDMQECR